ncbi:ABC transporter substrate-binding protein [Herbaspirillum sp. NPDC087042]|uniref:ABC transporter substrate-binding protein n=1 Tax=Herbaspirillum sp. NPDC087042 TaxID=3364004 RepID=UPI0038303CBA
MLAACGRADESGRAASAADPTVLTALVWAPDWPEEMQRVADAFMRAHPDVRINLQFMIGNSVEENLRPKAATDSLPDIFSVNPNPYTAGLADQGMLGDLGLSSTWGNMLEILQRAWTSPGGCRFGIPTGVATTLIYYNRDMFERAGIRSLPTDFEQFLALGATLRKAGLTPLALPGAFPNMLGNGPFSYGFANEIAITQPDWRARIASGTLALDNPEGVAIFGRLRALAEKKLLQADCLRSGYDATLRQFTDGQAAMTFQGTWAAGALMQSHALRVGVFAPPWNDKGRPLKPVIGSETGFAIAQRSSPRNRQLAASFIDFLYGPGMPIWQGKRKNIPPFKTIGPEASGDRNLFALVDSLQRSVAAADTPGLYYSYLPAETIDVLHGLLQAVLAGKQSPAHAARALQASIAEQARLAGK